MYKLVINETGYGWSLGVDHEWSINLNGDEDHQFKPTILSEDKDGWTVKFKNVVLGVSLGGVWNIHVK